MTHRRRPALSTARLVAGSLTLALGATLGAGCSSPDVATVEVDLFSGRENPTFPLSEDEYDSLDAISGSLAGGGGVPPRANLDFRGFVVATGSSRDGDDLRVLPGYVRTGQSTNVLADPQGLAHELLMQAAEEHLSDADFAALLESTRGG